MTEEKEFKAWLELQRRSIDLELTANGAWLHNGEAFTHRGLIDAFNRGIQLHWDNRDPIIKIGATWCYFRSTLTPFIGVRLGLVSRQLATVLLNTQERVSFEDVEPNYQNDRLTLDHNDGRHIRLNRSSQAAIAPFLCSDGERFMLETKWGPQLIKAN